MPTKVRDATPPQHRTTATELPLRAHTFKGQGFKGDSRASRLKIRALGALTHIRANPARSTATALAYVALLSFSTGLALLVDLFQRLAVLYLDLELQHLDLMELYVQVTSIPVP